MGGLNNEPSSTMIKKTFCVLLLSIGIVGVFVPDARQREQDYIINDSTISKPDAPLTPKKVSEGVSTRKHSLETDKHSQQAYAQTYRELQAKIYELESKINHISDENTGQVKTEIQNISKQASALAMATGISEHMAEQFEVPNANDMTIWYGGEPYKSDNSIPDIIEVNTKREIEAPEVNTLATLLNNSKNTSEKEPKSYSTWQTYFARILFLTILGGVAWSVVRIILDSFGGMMPELAKKAICIVIVGGFVIGPLCFVFGSPILGAIWLLWQICSFVLQFCTSGRSAFNSRNLTPLQNPRMETSPSFGSYSSTGQSPAEVIDTMQRSSLENSDSGDSNRLQNSTTATERRMINPSQLKSDAHAITSKIIDTPQKSQRKINLD